MDGPITRAEFAAYKEACETAHRRLEDEDKRQNERLRELETKQGKILDLASSVERLAVSVENMLDELRRHGNRITELENRDGDLWRTAVKYVLSALIGGAIAFAFTKLGG